MRIDTCILFLFFSTVYPALTNGVKAQDLIYIKVTDQQETPVPGVYVAHQQKGVLLATTDIDGICSIHRTNIRLSDTLQFQAIGYNVEKRCVKDFSDTILIRLYELERNLNEVVVRGLTKDQLLEAASSKLKKTRGRRIPLCYYYAPARYEKITHCRDTAIEYRREYGFYFYSGDLFPMDTWDRTYRSYLMPEYIARSYSLTVDGSDTIAPSFLTSEDIRFDVGTRKVFTLIRAVQLYAPLFSSTKNYDIKAVGSDSLGYSFSFKTKSEAYPYQTRITCKGTFVIDKERQELKSMEFDYIDYQLLRQILLTNKRNTSSPFSTKASLVFAYDSTGRNYIRSCRQTSIWKYDLGTNFVLIEQPSRVHPGPNKLVEEEAFYCYDQKDIPKSLQNERTLVKIHLAHRYPQGSYQPEIFEGLLPLLDAKQAVVGIERYMKLDEQFERNNGRAFYSENSIVKSPSDKNSLRTYREELYEARRSLFESFGHVPLPKDLKY